MAGSGAPYFSAASRAMLLTTAAVFGAARRTACHAPPPSSRELAPSTGPWWHARDRPNLSFAPLLAGDSEKPSPGTSGRSLATPGSALRIVPKLRMSPRVQARALLKTRPRQEQPSASRHPRAKRQECSGAFEALTLSAWESVRRELGAAPKSALSRCRPAPSVAMPSILSFLTMSVWCGEAHAYLWCGSVEVSRCKPSQVLFRSQLAL